MLRGLQCPIGPAQRRSVFAHQHAGARQLRCQLDTRVVGLDAPAGAQRRLELGDGALVALLHQEDAGQARPCRGRLAAASGIGVELHELAQMLLGQGEARAGAGRGGRLLEHEGALLGDVGELQRVLQVVERAVRQVQAHGVLRRASECGDRSAGEPIRVGTLRRQAVRLEQVTGQRLGHLVLRTSLEPARGGEMQRPALGSREGGIRDLAHQVLHEGELTTPW